MLRCPCTVSRNHYHIFWLCYVDTPRVKMLSHLHDTPPRLCVCVDSRNACHCVSQGHRYIHQGIEAQRLPLSFAKAAIMQTRKEARLTFRRRIFFLNFSTPCI